MNEDARLIRDVAASLSTGKIGADVKSQLCDLASRLEDPPGGPCYDAKRFVMVWKSWATERAISGNFGIGWTVGETLEELAESWPDVPQKWRDAEAMMARDRLKGDEK